MGGRGGTRAQTNPDTFVMNYVTPIRDTFTDWINISFYIILEIERRIYSY